MIPDNMDIWIKRYVDGKLKDADLQSFEEQLNKDPQLRAQLQEYKRVALLIKEHKLLSIKKMAAHTQARHERAVLARKTLMAVLLAAAITAGLAIWFVYTNPKTVSPKTTSTSAPIKSPSPQNVTSTVKATNKDRPIEHQAPHKIPTLQGNADVLPSLVHDSASVPITSPPRTTTNNTELQASTDRSKEHSIISNHFDCNGIQLTARFDVLASCVDEPTGVISHSSIQGGQAPYMAQLHNAQKIPVEQWHELAAGTYHVLLTDARQCQTWQHLTVDAKVCNRHYVFNPYLNETWEIPHNGKKGQLKIVDKKGNPYFSRNLISSEIAFWDGKSNNGEIKTGYYLFYIQHEDNTLTSGSVTIIE